jgi:outer membrane protein insertion porin family
VQVNLGFGGVSLPALRFDYGFSARNPRGVFTFRVGPVF